ncbi:MAG TPA: pentapeptide repeat-containing protein, partial [Ktedonobacterales bacterium]|nr:pentapeptide repeat-containing protein [Ktedonobacterales bacterium]
GFLDMLAGYGYKPIRTLLVYLIILLAFTGTYLAIGNGELSPIQALVFSITSFHGRGFFPAAVTVDTSVTVVAAAEAVIGLILEGSFIAIFTQRFFSR